jgi:hypothetical protein
MSAAKMGARCSWFGKHFSLKHRANLSIAHKGHHPSLEARLKMSKAFKGRPSWIKGKHQSEETRRKMSESHRNRLVKNTELHLAG